MGFTPKGDTLPDHLIRLEADMRGNGQAERLRGLEVDDQLELHGLLDGQVGRLGTLNLSR